MPSAPYFRIQQGADHVCLRGRDDHGVRFDLTMDRVWIMNLVLELENWLSGETDVALAS